MHARHKELLSIVIESLGGFFIDKAPSILRPLIEAIEDRDLNADGIYRLSGNSLNIRNLCEQCYFEDLPDFSTADIHELTGTVKTILRDMTPPLLTFNRYYAFIQAVTSEDERLHEKNMTVLLRKIPDLNFSILYYLAQHLRKLGFTFCDC